MASVVEVLLVFVRLGLLGFGGALGILPEMSRQVVDLRGWLSPASFADGYALGQLAPGPNMLAVVFYGYSAAGPLGGLAAGLGMFGPAAVIAALVARAWNRLGEEGWPRAVRAALLPIGAGLMAGGLLTLARGALTSAPAVAVAVASGLAVHRGLSPALAVLAGGLAGLALEVLR